MIDSKQHRPRRHRHTLIHLLLSPYLNHPPAYSASASLPVEIVKRCERAGADLVVCSPYQTSTLMERIQIVSPPSTPPCSAPDASQMGNTPFWSSWSPLGAIQKRAGQLNPLRLEVADADVGCVVRPLPLPTGHFELPGPPETVDRIFGPTGYALDLKCVLA